MKYILEIILIFITITCFSFLMEYKHETSNLKAKLNQTNSILHKYINNNTTLNKGVLTQEFKEDYYITQQQLNQDQIITFVSLLFGILAIIGIGIFSYVLSNFNQKIKEDYTKEYVKQQHLIKEAHIDINNIGFSFATSILLTADANSITICKNKRPVTGILRQMLKHRSTPKYCFKNLALSAARNILRLASIVKCRTVVIQ